MTDQEQVALDHAWRYFALHAEQRMSVFNFFVASGGLLLTGVVYAVQGPAELWGLGAAGGVLLAGLSFAFWKLDQRGGQLVKVAEDRLIAIEHAAILPTGQVFIGEQQAIKNVHYLSVLRPWTYGRSFRRIFAVIAILGLSASTASMLRHFSTRTELGARSIQSETTTAKQLKTVKGSKPAPGHAVRPRQTTADDASPCPGSLPHGNAC